MDLAQLKETLNLKALEFEISLESGKSHEELLIMYKELKELRYQILMAELAESQKETV